MNPMPIRPKFFVKFILPALLFIPVISQAAVPDFQTKTLSNGIKVIYHVQSHVNTTCIRIVLPTGLIYEPRRLRGISHLLEHLIFRGSDKIPPQELYKLVDEQGGYHNGFVSLDRTEFYMEVLPANLISALSIYLNFILQPGFTEQHITLEKKIVSVEQALHNFSANAFFLYLNELTQHQFDDSVNNISKNDLDKYHRQFYRPELMTVIVTGSFKPDEVFKLLQSFPGDTTPALPPAGWLYQDPAGNIVLEDYLMGEKYQVLFGFELKNLSEHDLMVAKVLPYILKYESHQYDHVNNRPVDYRISLFNLAGHYFLVFIYRDPNNPYSFEIGEWHQKNLERYFKYLQANNFEKFLARFSKSQEKELETLNFDPVKLNEYISLIQFDPAEITLKDLHTIQHLSTKDFREFVKKYLAAKYYQKIVVKAL
jgi:Zn-dependent M16 (insulinase) family peptidase